MTDTQTGGLEYLQSPSIAKLMPALLAAVADFDPMLKDATNPAFKRKYASLSSLFHAVGSALHAHQLLQTQQTSVDQNTGKNMVFTRIIHISGEWIGARWILTPAKPDPQGEGSALTYARRYTLTALLGIAAEDDDGAAASNNNRREAAAPPPPQEPSGRDWLAEAQELVGRSDVTAADRKGQLLQLMEECRAFGELAPLYGQFVQMGEAINAEIAART